MHTPLENIQFKRLETTDLFSLNHFLKQYKEPKVGKGDLAFWIKQVDNQPHQATNKILGCARLISQKKQTDFWLRGVFIDPLHRKQGLGSLLITKLHQAMQQEHDDFKIYAFPLGHLQQFYENLGYELIAATDLPTELQKRYLNAEKQNKGWLVMCFST